MVPTASDQGIAARDLENTGSDSEDGKRRGLLPSHLPIIRPEDSLVNTGEHSQDNRRHSVELREFDP